MHRQDGQTYLSATDLAQHLACRHLTQLDREVAEGRREPPVWRDPALDALRERGIRHETAYVNSLEQQGLSVVRLDAESGRSARAATLEALRQGADAVVQAPIQDRHWRGRVDVLRRVEQPSDLGNWSYEVVDTKLARDTRAGTILQLSLYTDLVATIQGRTPELMHVVKPGDGGLVLESFRFTDFQAYYRLVRRQLEAAVSVSSPPDTYPDPVPHCDVCRWWRACQDQRRTDDHLCLVAGVRSLHVRELNRQGITTLEQFAERPDPLPERPERGTPEAFGNAHAQAQMQLRGRKSGQLEYELLPIEPDQGFHRLPAPDAGDVFLDFEADPFVDGGGLEYLLGFSFLDAQGTQQYRADWALSRSAEREDFEHFIDFVMERWSRHPDMHVYHFSPYEPAALKRLMGRHATREAEMDQLLRSGRFVDLHAVARQSLRASVESYSLKELERFTPLPRSVDLRDASAARRRTECALELDAHDAVPPEDHRVVEAYNEDDCLQTAALRDWLEERRNELISCGQDVPRPEVRAGGASDAVAQRADAVQTVFDQLTAELPEDAGTWTDEMRARWLLAHLLDYFRREDRVAWWEFFRLHDLDYEELIDEPKAIAGLEFQGRAGGKDKYPVHRYAFPAQEVGLDVDDALHEVGGESVGKLHAIDESRGLLEIRKAAKAADTHPSAVVVLVRVNPGALDQSLLALASSIVQHGFDGDGPFRAARDLIRKIPPRFTDQKHGGSLRQPDESASEAAVRLVRGLDHSVLAIQGPPGAGKTFTGAQMILQLARAGRRVGVTAVSHKVIRNLIEKVIEAADGAGFSVEAAHRCPGLPNTPDAIEEAKSNPKALAALDNGKIVGGTAWLWADDDAVESLDYLFVDEAGQMSLAQVLAASRAARNLVLLGDPQQLQQPQRGAHPEGAEISALQHLLDGHETIPEDRGLFLDVTWRLPPPICTFTSEQYYEERLNPRPENVRQEIVGDSPFAGSGLFHVSVPHDGNQNVSREEIDAVERIVGHLLQAGLSWRDTGGDLRELGSDDILIVAPYNAQVNGIARRLPNARVGTVDRFQGQEAPVVVYTLTSSSAEDAPRGMQFLYDPHRLNVATSRARCICMLVGSDRLFEPECRAPEQMRWANGLCRYRELATRVERGMLSV